MAEDSRSAYFRSLKRFRKDDIEDLDGYTIGGFYPVDIGDIFLDKYNIYYKLGHGGFGTVFAAIDRKNGKCVALKFLKAEDSAVPESAPFKKEEHLGYCECEINDNLQEINEHGKKHLAIDVEYLFDSSDNGKHMILVSDLLGPCVQDFFHAKMLPVKTLRSLAKQAAEAMKALHDFGVAHGDFTTRNMLMKLRNTRNIKPHNIKRIFGAIQKEELRPRKSNPPTGSAPKYVYESVDLTNLSTEFLTGEELTIIDFGLAHKFEDRPPGCPPTSYLAPDTLNRYLEGHKLLGSYQPENSQTSAASDIWCLANVIFELRAGEPLFASQKTRQEAAELLRHTLADEWDVRSRKQWRCVCSSCQEFHPEFSQTLRERIRKIGLVGNPERLQNRGHAEWISHVEAEDLYDLLRKMLRYKPSDRPNIHDVLAHPWFSREYCSNKRRLTTFLSAEAAAVDGSESEEAAIVPEAMTPITGPITVPITVPTTVPQLSDRDAEGEEDDNLEDSTLEEVIRYTQKRIRHREAPLGKELLEEASNKGKRKRSESAEQKTLEPKKSSEESSISEESDEDDNEEEARKRLKLNPLPPLPSIFNPTSPYYRPQPRNPTDPYDGQRWFNRFHPGLRM